MRWEISWIKWRESITEGEEVRGQEKERRKNRKSRGERTGRGEERRKIGYRRGEIRGRGEEK